MQVPANAVIAVPPAREVADYEDNLQVMSDHQAAENVQPPGSAAAVLQQVSPYIRFQVSGGHLVGQILQGCFIVCNLG